MAQVFANHVDALSLVGVDPNPEHTHAFEQQLSGEGFDVRVFTSGFEEFQSDRSYDVIHFIHCLYYFEHIEPELRKAVDMLVPDAELAERQLEIAIRDALTDMREAYYQYLFVIDAIAINQENQQLLEQMIEVAQTKLRTGKAKYNAVIMAQVELSKLEDAIITLREQKETYQARINTLLSRPAEAGLGSPKPVIDLDLAPAFDKLYDIAVEGRQ